MTMKPVSLVHVVALTAMITLPAAAQSARTGAQSAPRTAPAPAPVPAPAPAPRTTTTTTTPSAPVGTSGTTVTAAPPTVGTAGARPWNQEYRLGPGDKLRVEVYGEPQLSQALQIRPDGKITLTLVGDVVAAGRTSLELRDALTTSLKAYVNNPAVTVIVQEAIANQIDVAGEVANPGQQVLMGPVTILQAISRAGGLKEFAKAGSIYVLRPGKNGPQRLDAAYKDALKGKVPPMVLQPGDTVVVP
jgi:polysaccharide export outer membrane protein